MKRWAIFNISDAGVVTFARVGVPASDVATLNQLTNGSLRKFLARAPDWAALLTSRRLAMYLATDGLSFVQIPVAADIARGVNVAFTPDAIVFTTSTPLFTNMAFALRFKHSLTF